MRTVAIANNMNKRILVIEDTTSFRRLIRMTLEFDGFTVIEAEDGTKGLALAQTEDVDLILLDLMLPGISGLEVCKQIRSSFRLRDTPIVLLSSSEDSNDIEACLQAGAKDYLMKPFRPPMLLDVIYKHIGATVKK